MIFDWLKRRMGLSEKEALREDGLPADPKCKNCGHRLSQHGFYYDGDSDCKCGKCRNGFSMLCPICQGGVSLGVFNQWGMCATCFNKTKEDISRPEPWQEE